jgi:hypothetical protein
MTTASNPLRRRPIVWKDDPSRQETVAHRSSASRSGDGRRQARVAGTDAVLSVPTGLASAVKRAPTSSKRRSSPAGTRFARLTWTAAGPSLPRRRTELVIRQPLPPGVARTTRWRSSSGRDCCALEFLPSPLQAGPASLGFVCLSSPPSGRREGAGSVRRFQRPVDGNSIYGRRRTSLHGGQHGVEDPPGNESSREPRLSLSGVSGNSSAALLSPPVTSIPATL